MPRVQKVGSKLACLLASAVPDLQGLVNSSVTLYYCWVHQTSSFLEIYKIVRLKRIPWLAPTGRQWEFELEKMTGKGISGN